jgi:CcmD family protein
MTYLVAAYAVLWAISFGLVFSIVLRQRRLQQELKVLRQVVEDEPRSNSQN